MVMTMIGCLKQTFLLIVLMRRTRQQQTVALNYEMHYAHRPLIMELILWLMWLPDLPLPLLLLLVDFGSFVSVVVIAFGEDDLVLHLSTVVVAVAEMIVSVGDVDGWMKLVLMMFRAFVGQLESGDAGAAMLGDDAAKPESQG